MAHRLKPEATAIVGEEVTRLAAEVNARAAFAATKRGRVIASSRAIRNSEELVGLVAPARRNRTLTREAPSRGERLVICGVTERLVVAAVLAAPPGRSERHVLRESAKRIRRRLANLLGPTWIREPRDEPPSGLSGWAAVPLPFGK